MYCPKCGKQIPDGSTSCPSCGATFQQVPTQAGPGPYQPYQQGPAQGQPYQQGPVQGQPQQTPAPSTGNSSTKKTNSLLIWLPSIALVVVVVGLLLLNVYFPTASYTIFFILVIICAVGFIMFLISFFKGRRR